MQALYTQLYRNYEKTDNDQSHHGKADQTGKGKDTAADYQQAQCRQRQDHRPGQIAQATDSAMHGEWLEFTEFGCGFGHRSEERRVGKERRTLARPQTQKGKEGQGRPESQRESTRE